MSMLLFTILVSATFSVAQGGSMPRPPGIRQADQAEAQAEKNIPPPHYQVAPIDVAKLRRDSDVLASLAQSIPPDIDKVAQGMLPKDVIGKLKQLEKLSKRLRSELAP
jgi:hypothetical protein